MPSADPIFLRRLYNASGVLVAAPGVGKKLILHGWTERNKSATAVAGLVIRAGGTAITPTSAQIMSGLGAIIPFNPQGWASAASNTPMSAVVTGACGGNAVISIRDATA